MAFSFRLLSGMAASCICAAVATSPSPAAAQGVDPEIIDAQTGTYVVAPLDGKPGCTVTLTKDETIGGYAIAGAETCATALPAIADAYAWNFSGPGVMFIDPTRKVLATFEENEGSPLTTASERPLALVVPPGTIDHLPTQQALAGTWLMKRPSGESLCTVTLKANTETGQDGTMSPMGDCAAAVTKLKLEYWQINTFDVTLMSGEGDTLSFTMTADGNFEKTKEEGGKPLLLIRQ